MKFIKIGDQFINTVEITTVTNTKQDTTLIITKTISLYSDETVHQFMQRLAALLESDKTYE